MKNYKIIDRKINVLITVHLHLAEIFQIHCDRYRGNIPASIYLEQQISQLPPYRRLIITAKGDAVDFVSRFFTPQSTHFEDPVTGSAHCSLIPYWAKELKKSNLVATQLSERQGQLFCTNNGERVRISGYAKTYSIGKCWIK